MTTAGQWLAGARPRTLGAAVAPVAVGTAVAYAAGGEVLWWRAGGALAVALGLQVGVNYANDYSDGVRGTDAARAGPLRLTASGLAAPAAVRNVAALAFGVAVLAGLALAVAVDLRLALVGLLCLAAGVLYTGGPRPYGYAGLGEVAVFVFFGLVATGGSAYVQLERVPAAAWWAGSGLGLLACGILLANNVRDLDGDRAAGKRTLAVRLGAGAARGLYVACVAGAFAAVLGVGISYTGALLALLAAPLAVRPVRLMLTATAPAAFVPALVGTVRLELVVGALLTIGLALS